MMPDAHPISLSRCIDVIYGVALGAGTVLSVAEVDTQNQDTSCRNDTVRAVRRPPFGPGTTCPQSRPREPTPAIPCSSFSARKGKPRLAGDDRLDQVDASVFGRALEHLDHAGALTSRSNPKMPPACRQRRSRTALPSAPIRSVLRRDDRCGPEGWRRRWSSERSRS